MWKRYRNARFSNINDLRTSYTDIDGNNGTVSPNLIPNDLSFGRLWGLNRINAPQAWDKTTGSKNVVVAVVDTGVDYTHPDLAGNIWRNPGEIPGNGIDDDGNGYIDDVYGWDFGDQDNNPTDDHPNPLAGHGTHVSGILGAVGNNNLGVIGVSPNVSIMPTKHFRTTDNEGYLWGVSDGIYYAVDNGAKIINLSLGSSSFDQAQYNALKYAYENNVLVIAAAGNSSRDIDRQPYYPASYDLPNIISVAATNERDELAWFSNYGVNSVDLAAPGENIYSTIPDNRYVEWSGTSMAVPHVAGAAALLLSVNPTLSVLDLRYALLSSVTPLKDLQGKVNTGGILNVDGAYQKIAGNNQPRPDSLTNISPIHIEAENYKNADDLTPSNQGGMYRRDLGVDIENTNDIGGGYNITGIQAGEWLSYDFNILVDGIYDVVARVASGGSGDKQIKAVINNQQEQILSFAPTEGYQIWTDAIATGFSLSAGSHQLRLDMLSDDFNLNYIKLIPANNNETLAAVANNPSPSSIENQSLDPSVNRPRRNSTRPRVSAYNHDPLVGGNENGIITGDYDTLISGGKQGILARDWGGIFAENHAIAQLSHFEPEKIEIGASFAETDTQQLRQDPLTGGFSFNSGQENIDVAGIRRNFHLS